METLPLLFRFVLFERYDRCNDLKKDKGDHTLSEKKGRGGGGRLSVCFCTPGSNTVKISDWNSQNRAGDRSNATCSHHYLFNVLEAQFGNISWWVTNRAVQLISIVSLCLQDCIHQFLPWLGATIFGAIIQIVGQKCRQKMVMWSFLGYLGRDRVGFSTCLDRFEPSYALLCHGQCFQFSGPNLQLMRLDFKKLYPIFGWPSPYTSRHVQTIEKQQTSKATTHQSIRGPI